MANRRMFSMKVVDTDAFLDMPQSSQLLYYSLAMRADDDGFIANPKKVMRMIGSQEDDYKILCMKKFIIQFNSGICVIKHWLIHNLIRSDRYAETQYVREMEQLTIDPKTKKYSLNKGENDVIPTGNHLAPQVRLGKDRIEDKAPKGAEVEKVYDFKEKIKLMKASKDVRMPIIAFYWFFKEWTFNNEKQYSAALRRELRPAKDLSGYTLQEIDKAMDYCKKNITTWTLETVHKRITDLVNKK